MNKFSILDKPHYIVPAENVSTWRFESHLVALIENPDHIPSPRLSAQSVLSRLRDVVGQAAGDRNKDEAILVAVADLGGAFVALDRARLDIQMAIDGLKDSSKPSHFPGDK